jgi:hypothetical protein
MKDFTLLKMEGKLVDIMCNVYADYKKFACYENGKKVLYLELLKAFYGCIQSALLWYELFSSTLQGMSFELNPSETCIENKVIDGKQCTIVWHVDDTNISHEDSKALSDVIQKIEARFGQMTVTCLLRHDHQISQGRYRKYHDEGLHQGGHRCFWRGHHKVRHDTREEEPFRNQREQCPFDGH